MTDYFTPDPREKNLPKWAQGELNLLRMRLQEAQKRIDELNGVAETDTIANPYAEYPQNLPSGTSIEFRLGSDIDEFIRARVTKGRTLDLNAGTGISVLPRGSTAIEIAIRGR